RQAGPWRDRPAPGGYRSAGAGRSGRGRASGAPIRAEAAPASRGQPQSGEEEGWATVAADKSQAEERLDREGNVGKGPDPRERNMPPRLYCEALTANRQPPSAFDEMLICRRPRELAKICIADE